MSSFSGIQRSQIRALLIALRTEKNCSARWLYGQIVQSEAVGRYRERHPAFAMPKDHILAETVVSQFLGGKSKPQDDTMNIFIEFLTEKGALNKAYFLRLGAMDIQAAVPMSDRMRSRLHAFPHDATYACDTRDRSRIKVHALHLKKTQTAKQAALQQTSVYTRRLNETDQFLVLRAEAGFCDIRSELSGELAWTGKLYHLKLGESQIDPRDRTYVHPRLADCVLHEDASGHHSLEVVFWEPTERLVLYRCTPLHKEPNPPNLTKMHRINMMEVRRRFLLEVEPFSQTPLATKKDAGSDTIVEDQKELDAELIEAARVGDAHTMALAIIKGADINAKEVGGQSASVLHMVAQARSSLALDVMLYNPKLHQDMIEDLIHVGVTDLAAANTAILDAQQQLDAAVVDNKYVFPSEYVQDTGPPKTENDILTKHQNYLYTTLMALEDTHLVRKGMPHGLSFGYDPEERAKYFDVSGAVIETSPPPEP